MSRIPAATFAIATLALAVSLSEAKDFYERFEGSLRRLRAGSSLRSG